MSEIDETREVIIFRMIGDKLEQGSEEARVKASAYKWAPTNAINRWVKEHHPKPGWYAAVDPVGYNYGNGRRAVMNIFTVSYPDYVIKINGREDIKGERDPHA